MKEIWYTHLDSCKLLPLSLLFLPPSNDFTNILGETYWLYKIYAKYDISDFFYQHGNS